MGHHSRRLTGEFAKSIRISHRGSPGAGHEFSEDISINSSERTLIGALQLAMANVFLTRPYNVLELLEVLQLLKEAPQFHSRAVQQDIKPEPPARPYIMKIRFKDGKSKIEVSVNVGGYNVFSCTPKKNHRKTIEMIRYLEEEYENL